ncbi:MAG: hypothetical protein JNL69_06845 [Bacteroidia bacterium]|nr:hypothetical protein [Bacteroidia bacterium]
MKKRNLFLPLLFCLLFVTSKSQPAIDTIKKSLQLKPHLFAKLDSRNSFIDNSLVHVFGAKAGVKFGSKLRFGIGYNQLYNPPKGLNQNIEYVNELGKPYFISRGLKFYYFSASIDYAFYQSKKWEVSMPLQIGIGESYFQHYYNGQKTKTDKSINFIYEPAISIEYKLLKWIGIGADFGYRFMFTDNRKLNQQLTSPIVTFDLVIYYREIYKSLFPNSKLSKKT